MIRYQPFARNRPSTQTKIPYPSPLRPSRYENLNLLAPVNQNTKKRHNAYIRNEKAALDAYHQNEYSHKKHLLNHLASRHLFSIPEENHNLSNEAGNQFMKNKKQHYETLASNQLRRLRNKQANRSRRMEKKIVGMLSHRRTKNGSHNGSPLPTIAPRHSFHQTRKNPLRVKGKLPKKASIRRALPHSLALMEDPVLSQYASPMIKQYLHM
jgi:hypothetical protein